MCSDLPVFCCLLKVNVMLCTTVQSVYVSAVFIAAIPIYCYRIDILFTFVKNCTNNTLLVRCLAECDEIWHDVHSKS